MRARAREAERLTRAINRLRREVVREQRPMRASRTATGAFVALTITLLVGFALIAVTR